ncbi:QcrA and Rieske domain-containing protein [Bythopirellula goksoeyrii]|uniref:Arsenite oxidase subunit AioB n=1 Tax=Bythopirellula goksoeyrii TaxID=1400387 RepID=A0A5B9QRZ3_9BACT|nr:Rieske 2Fe-2S domain-containing protein [Bythopirellula goksoeyrii]QEG36753.1 Arsenite oxidase subunit AioB precursor [Bythopirellula goksoeyrii]
MEHDKAPKVSFPDGRPECEQPKWRRDFPIEVEADEYGARRDFTKFMVLTSLAFVCGQFWIALHTFFRGYKPGEQRIAKVDDIAVGEAMSFHYPTDRDPCLLIRKSEDDFVAYSSQCTHLMCPVQPDLENDRLHCPCHRGFFDVATGRPTAGPPRRPLPRIELRIAKGNIYATNIEVSAS